MHKFKVGDKVRILDGSKIQDYAGGWVYTMGNFVGREAPIKSLKNCIGRPAYHLYGNVCTWDERGLELVEQKDTIVIYRKSNETIAIRKENGKEVKRAVAKCSPDDTYDFQTGAKIAMDRLFEPEKPKGYTHKIVCVESSARFRVGKPYEVKDGTLFGENGIGYKKGCFDGTPYKNVDEINADLTAKFIELVEEE